MDVDVCLVTRTTVNSFITGKNQVNSAKLRMPFVHHLPGVDKTDTPQRARLIVPALLWVLLVNAARPQWLGEPITLPAKDVI